MDCNPFHKSIDLISIETGEVADCSVNAYLANEIGEKIIRDMEGIPVHNYSFKTKDKAKIMNTSSNIKLDNEVVPVDPHLLFQQSLATVIRDNDIDMQQVFQYELSTSPASLFDEKDGLMRKADKPKLSADIWKYVDLQMEHPKNASFVIDGGSLLQKIQGWPKGSSFKSICKLYKDYVLKHYGAGTAVVFDGGYENPSTKDTTHLRRSKFKQGVVVHFTENMIFNMKKNEFLLNKVNKQHFLKLLTREMNSKYLVAKQASCDADLDIVLAGLNASETSFM